MELKREESETSGTEVYWGMTSSNRQTKSHIDEQKDSHTYRNVATKCRTTKTIVLKHIFSTFSNNMEDMKETKLSQSLSILLSTEFKVILNNQNKVK